MSIGILQKQIEEIIMLKKRYETLLKDPASFKVNVIKIIKDIEERLKGVESGEVLETTFADINHNHDNTYSAIDHNHDESYSAIDHNHDSDYAGINHNHDSEYSAIDHNHDSDYAPVNHVHMDLCHMAGFTVSDTSGTISVPVDGDINVSSVVFVEDSSKFTAVSVSNGLLHIRYNVDNADVGGTFHFIYLTGVYVVAPANTVDLTLPDNGEDPNLRITATLTDDNDDPVDDGTVTFNLTKIE